MKPPVFLLFAVTSIVVGWFIPAFYDWTGSNQSNSPPIVNQTVIGLPAIAFVICLALPWLPVGNDPPATYEGDKFQFNIRTILLITAASAALMTLFPKSILLVLGTGLYATALLYVVQCWIAFRPLRWRMISLLACMYLPFVWIISSDLFFQAGYQLLLLVSGLPMLMPMLFISSLVRQHPDQMAWLSSILASAELMAGMWTIRRGKRWAIAFQLWALMLSTFGSFILNTLMRM